MQFDFRQAVSIAMEMERRGEDFYRRAARVSKSDEAIALLNRLAEDEKTHLADFRKLSQRLCGGECEPYDEETSAFLTAVAADIVFPGGLMGLLPGDGFSSPRAVLLYAIRSEKDSILFYTELIAHSSDGEAEAVVREILDKEKWHLRRLVAMCEALEA